MFELSSSRCLKSNGEIGDESVDELRKSLQYSVTTATFGEQILKS
jgi:hypothetical protein